MDPGRQAMINSSRSPAKDITAPRRDDRNRIAKPLKATLGHRTPDFKIPQKKQLYEDEQTRQWVAQEDVFVLKQAKKKADIRVREGRAKPIDWLAVILRVIDPDKDLLEDDEEEVQLDVVDPEGVFEGLDEVQLAVLEKDISSYLALETEPKNQDYWKTMQVICKDRRDNSKPRDPEKRAVSSVAADVDKLLGPKSFEQLETLDKQINAKLRSDQDIDVDYWEQLLRSLLVWKAKAKLKKVYQAILEAKQDLLRKEQQVAAEVAKSKFVELLTCPNPVGEEWKHDDPSSVIKTQPTLSYSSQYDPEPMLKLRGEDRSRHVVDEASFLEEITNERRKVLKLGYIPLRYTQNEKNIKQSTNPTNVGNGTRAPPGTQRFSTIPSEDCSQATKTLYDREVARGIDENEEVFTGEETVASSSTPQWADKHRPRKPRYFNRVQMGYEWNKYNQTHYDHDNPPPKVVQGYKFNIFYPDLIDKARAPTYRIIREHGRQRGESFAPAGEEDTCLIRFTSGPPYEDIAFRIVDKEWDYSAKRDRGFRSTFDKGILQLHFQYKKIYYRK